MCARRASSATHLLCDALPDGLSTRVTRANHPGDEQDRRDDDEDGQDLRGDLEPPTSIQEPQRENKDKEEQRPKGEQRARLDMDLGYRDDLGEFLAADPSDKGRHHSRGSDSDDQRSETHREAGGQPHDQATQRRQWQQHDNGVHHERMSR